MSKASPPTVIVRYDDDGEIEFYAEGIVRFLVIDERAPDDRVYEVRDRYTREQIMSLIGDDDVGHQFDGSDAARKLGQTGTN